MLALLLVSIDLSFKKFALGAGPVRMMMMSHYESVETMLSDGIIIVSIDLSLKNLPWTSMDDDDVSLRECGDNAV
jgi:hypothetical protein